MGLFDKLFGGNKEKVLAALSAAPPEVKEPPVPKVKAVPKTAKQLATEANAKKLFFTHHEPTRSDASLDAIYQSLLRQQPADLVA